MTLSDPRRQAGRRSVVIESLGSYLPERVVSTADVVAGCAVPLRIPLERLTGIRNRRAAASDEFSVDLARSAAADCLSRSRHGAESIDLLICASISHYDAPEHIYSFEPSAAMRLKAAFGFERAVAFDLSNGCAGLWSAILLAEAMISAGLIERAMIVSGEFITELSRTAQREIESYLDPQVASLTVGDSGIALTLEAGNGNGAGFEALDLYTLSRYAGYCTVRPSEKEHGGGVMVTDSVRIGARSIEHVVTHLADTLREAGWSPRDVSHLVPHQTSETTLVDGFKRINERFDSDPFPVERFRINLAERGNTATTAHFVAIQDSVDSGLLQNGERAAFCITGSGLSIGTALYTFDDLPDRLRNGNGHHVVEGSAAAVPARMPYSRPPRIEAPVAGIAGIGLVRGAEAAGLETVELCRRAGSEGLDRAGCVAEDVELVIHSGVYRTGFIVEPAIAALAAGALEMNAASAPGTGRRTFALDLLAGHLGTLKACSIADSMIRAGRFRRALVLASDVKNTVSHGQSGISGLEPAGSALLMEAGSRGAGFELFHFRDFPEHIAAFGAYVENPDGRPRLVVHRRPEFVECAAECLARTVRDLLASLDLSLDCFDAILAPSGPPGLETAVRDLLGIGPDRWVVVAPFGGDLVSSSLAAGLRALDDDGKTGPGARILVLAAGAGIQTGCALVRFG